MDIKKYNYNQLTQLSLKDKMYILETERLKDYYSVKPELANFKSLIELKSKQSINRNVLAEVLKEQYESYSNTSNQLDLIDQLKSENTFTITTAHQPSLLTGPLYYIFKIASVINLSKQLKHNYPSYNFIPCFITGGEDHDFEEINHLSLFGKDIVWEDNDWDGGSVGQASTNGIDQVVSSISQILGQDSYIGKWLESKILPLLKTAKNYSEFARALTHELFGQEGILILSMDDERLKHLFIQHIKEEIFNQPSEELILNTQKELAKLGWKPQAHARNINFFYRTQKSRSRIIFDGLNFTTNDNKNNWTKDELETEIENNPGSFSPNVVMRPIYQESILPNLAYIGGGGEIAYWLERKVQFEYFKIPFPMLIRRNSAMIVSHSLQKLLMKNDIEFKNYFQQTDDLIKYYMSSKNQDSYSLEAQEMELQKIMGAAIEKAKNVDPTLEKFAQAEVAKMKKGIEAIEKKIHKAIKKKEEIELNRIAKVQNKLFPSKGLQERKENIFQYINDYGFGLITKLVKELNPLEKKFIVFFMQPLDLLNQEQKK